MPVSASIYSQIQQPEPVNQLDSLARAYKEQAMQQDMQMGRMKMDEYQRGVTRQNKLAQLLSGDYADDNQRADALLKGGFLKEGQDYRKNAADVASTQAGTRAKQIEAAKNKLDIAGQAFGYVKDNPTPDAAMQTVQYLVQNGVWDEATGQAAMAKVQENPTPEAIRALATQAYQSALSAKDQLPKVQNRNLGGVNRQERVNFDGTVQTLSDDKITESEAQRLARERQAADAAAGRAVTMRGQNMTDARAGAALQLQRDKLTADGKTDKAKTTEGERTAGALLQRLRSSQLQLEDALTTNPDAAKPGVIASGLRSVGQEALANTVAVGEERQQVEAAQLDILDAALTLGTGAAYTREQLEGYRKSYFPQLGDKPATIADKRARLENILQAAEIKAGAAASQIPSVQQMKASRPSRPNPKADRAAADAILRGG